MLHIADPDTQLIDVLGGVADLCEDSDETEAAVLLRQDALQLSGRGCTVVVVGEKNRGKSSLINALLGRQNLLPVDADVSTNAYLTVGFAKKEGASIHSAEHPLGHAQIELAEVATYAALDNSVDPPVARHPDVERVDVGVDAEILRNGLVLVDTPGVGGLVAGHTALTLSILERADALLFVVSGGVELRASEVEFLKLASARVPTVLFAMTGIDKFPGFPAVLKANRTHLREHAPRFAAARWFEVSNTLKVEADRAAADGDAEFAADLLDESGFAPLIAELSTNLAGRIARDRERLLLDAATGLLRRVDGQAEQRLRSLDGDTEATLTIAAQRDEIADLSESHAQWRANLASRFVVLQTRLGRRATEGLMALRTTAETAATAGGRNVSLEVQRNLRDGAQAIVADLENALYAEAVSIVASLTDDFGVQGVEVMAAELPPGVGVGAIPRFDGANTASTVTQPGEVAWPTPAASGLPALRGGINLPVISDSTMTFGRDAALGAIGRIGQGWRGMSSGRQASVAVAAVAVVAGIAAAAFAIFKGMERQKTRDALLIYIDDAIRSLQQDLSHGVRETVASLRDDLTARADDRLAQRARRLEQALARAEADQHATDAQLAPLRAELAARRDRAGALLDEVAELQRQRT